MEEIFDSWIFMYRSWHEEPSHVFVRWALDLFAPPGKDDHLLVVKETIVGCLYTACNIAVDKNALVLEIRSMEEVAYSAIGIKDYYFKREGKNQVVIQGAWQFREFESGIPSGVNYIINPVFSQIKKNGGIYNVNGYWHSRFFVFGESVGNEQTLANIRYVRSEARKIGLSFTPLKMYEIAKFKSGEQVPALVLVQDMFDTVGLLFHQETLCRDYPEFWLKVTAVNEREIIDAQLLLDTEVLLGKATRKMILEIIQNEFCLPIETEESYLTTWEQKASAWLNADTDLKVKRQYISTLEEGEKCPTTSGTVCL